MTRLRSELQRLYFPDSAEPSAADAAHPAHGRLASLVDAKGKVRAMVLEVSQPANWELASAVWRGVQRDLDLPAPAIAVSGLDGFQLWFSLAEAVPVPQACDFLEALRARFVADVAPRRIRLMPGAQPSADGSLHHELIVPARQQTGNWSAFVAPDLAPIFVDTPWLDIQPGEDGQAELLRGVRSIRRSEWASAQEQLGLTAPASISVIKQPEPSDATLRTKETHPVSSAAVQDPRQFLLKVMNDDSVPLVLRIESAKALLQHPDVHGSGQGG